mmetsp:Transcript_20149/g.46958  ORF Transcript_20149/g.46958 Transcript_20149/m.46958 type:complete len:917 (+) Transcript_20149:116-2866(+)|eukprot:CAMPEP_0178395660 /NCGR_PEP_ID=MMETSP0689_2-20121128/13333_1 /TAXON_ID=160604 /ORGANISM="Amphidinium massartii, Strain CS-259" /LENGTH=916 /DNA_ID=CAMNT_0020016321 /DNA_START=33 /DNA_END=2783 /DNA_ORIENTATION=+
MSRRAGDEGDGSHHRYKAWDSLMRHVRQAEPTGADLEDLNRLLRNRPDLLHWAGDMGMTPVNACIHYESHEDVQLLLLEACSRQVSNPLVHTFDGKQTVHLAMDRHVSLPVIYKLVSVYPEAVKQRDEDGRYLLHMVLEYQPFPATFIELCSTVLNVFPEAATVKSRDLYPLHFCLMNGVPHRLLVQILRAHRAAAGVPTWEGKLPLHIAIENNCDVRTISVLLAAYPEAMLKKMTNQQTVLEYALQAKRPVTTLECLLDGGADRKVSKRALASARASAMGRCCVITSDSGSAMQWLSRHGHHHGQLNAKKLHVMVQWCEEEAISVEVDPSQKVSTLKQEIQRLKKVPATIQRVSFEGRQLLDDVEIERYHIPPNNTLLARPHSDILAIALANGAHEDLMLKLIGLNTRFAMEDDRNGHLPLHIAIKNRASESVVLKLLEANGRAARVPQAGASKLPYPLHLALKYGYSLQVIRTILTTVGNSPHDWKKDGSYDPRGEMMVAINPLNVAIEADAALQVVDLLLEKKCPLMARCADNGMTVLDDALVSRREVLLWHLLPKITALINSGGPAGEEALRQFEEPGFDRQTPLHLAVVHRASKESVVKLCAISKVATIVADPSGSLPLHASIKSGCSFAVIREIIRNNHTVVSQPDLMGRTPLQLAVIHHGAAGVVMEICHYDKNAAHHRDECGRTMMQLAIDCNAPPWIVEELMKVNSQNPVKSVGEFLTNLWPHNRASAEVQRLRTTPKGTRRTQINEDVQEWLDDLDYDERVMLHGGDENFSSEEPLDMMPHWSVKELRLVNTPGAKFRGQMMGEIEEEADMQASVSTANGPASEFGRASTWASVAFSTTPSTTDGPTADFGRVDTVPVPSRRTSQLAGQSRKSVQFEDELPRRASRAAQAQTEPTVLGTISSWFGL